MVSAISTTAAKVPVSSPTRVTVFEDIDGRKYKVLVAVDAPDSMAKHGLKLGPPEDIDRLGLPIPIMVRLHNQLFERGIITAKDAMKGRLAIQAAIKAAIALDAERLLEVYHSNGNNNHNNG